MQAKTVCCMGYVAIEPNMAADIPPYAIPMRSQSRSGRTGLPGALGVAEHACNASVSATLICQTCIPAPESVLRMHRKYGCRAP